VRVKLSHLESSNTGSTETENSLITKDLIDWLLYDLPYLRERCEEIMPKTSTSIVLFHPKTKSMVRSKIEIVAVKRAALTQVLDAVERAIKKLPSRDHRNVYRMKWRAGMTIREISKRVFLNPSTVQEKTVQVRDLVALYLQAIPASDIRQFFAQNQYKNET